MVFIRIVSLACLGLFPSAIAFADDALISVVRDGHRANRESIRSLTAKMTCENIVPNKGIQYQARYWRSGKVARVQEGTEGSHTEDYGIKGGEIRRVGRSWTLGKKSPTTVAVREPATAFLGPCDVWREMLLELTGPDGGQLDMDRTLESADGPIKADRDTLDGRASIRLRYTRTYPSGGKTRLTQWHEIGRNYLISKLIVEYPDDSSVKGIVNVTDFVELSPGILFPIRVQRDQYRNGEITYTMVAALTDVEINKPVPESSLALPTIPRGTHLRDQIENKEGLVDSDWQPIGVMKPLAPRPVPPSNRAPLAAPVEGTPSTSEPTSYALWIVRASALLLLLATGIAVGRRILFRRRLLSPET